jgi:hypothetical protein
MSLRLQLALAVAALVVGVAGIVLWRTHGLSVWLESGLAFCA